jgi:predicted short-subunit dehydrogenase-like oxidoreductase (DUF2520 family)
MDRTFKRIGFVGAGRTATALSLAMRDAGCSVTAVASRSPESARRLADRLPGCEALPSPESVTANCDVVFLTVPDDAVASVAEALPWRADQAAVHCSGALSLAVLDAARDGGASVGGLHPLQTFVGNDVGAGGLAGTTFAVQGDGKLREWLEGVVENLGGSTVNIGEHDRPLYHAAAVMSCGYLATMLDAACDLWGSMGFSREEALRALLPLARGTLNNVETQGTRGGATGPIVRGDVETVRLHLETLAQQAPHVLPLYCQTGLAMVSMASLSQDTTVQLKELLTAHLVSVEESVRG